MNKGRILIAEDDPNFGLVLKSYLGLQGFAVTLTNDGNKALSALQQHPFDLCILDVMMPFRDGFSVAEVLKKQYATIPFIFLTAKALKSDQVKGYQLGAIDYLIKPFDPEILLLKIQALLRQISVEAPSAVAYQIGNFTFQPSQRALSHADKLWQLSPKESELLHLLCNKQSEVLTRTEALVKIWGEDSFFTAQSMNVYVSRLRKYFRTDADHPVRIDNLHSKGFRLQPSAQALEY